jgi:uncharacterized membrane protein YczE
MMKPTSSKSPRLPEKPLEPFGFVAVALAIFFMITTFEADILWMLHKEGLVALQWIVWISCFLAVFIPFLVSCYRQRSNPNRWRGRWVLVVIGIILALNVAQLIMARHFHAI